MPMIAAEVDKNGERKLRRVMRLGKYKNKSVAIRESIDSHLAELEAKKQEEKRGEVK